MIRPGYDSVLLSRLVFFDTHENTRKKGLILIPAAKFSTRSNRERLFFFPRRLYVLPGGRPGGICSGILFPSPTTKIQQIFYNTIYFVKKVQKISKKFQLFPSGTIIREKSCYI